MKGRLLGMTLTELQKIIEREGLPKFTSKQIADWLYKKNISSIDEMTNLSKKTRKLLNELYETGITPPLKFETGSDGTKKYLFPVSGNNHVETAMIPDRERITVCVSTQAGCRMGCVFCMTAREGFRGNLSAGEILNQVKSIHESDSVSNIVFMGMGEPLDNPGEVLKSIEILTSGWGFAMSPRRITVSTVGIIPAMIRFLEKSEAHLAVSLHTPFNTERQKLMPVQVKYPIEDIISEIKKWDFGRQRRVSFEYILFEGFNDSPIHVKELSKLLSGLKCRVNLIKFHPIPGSDFKSPKKETIENFKNQLNRKGILTTIRASRGEDINAACGLLSGVKNKLS